MLVRYFSSNKAGLTVIFLCLALLLWLNTWVYPQGAATGGSELTGPLGWLLIKFSLTYPGISSFVGLMVVLICGFLLVRLNSKYFFLKSRSQLPLLFFFVVTGCIAVMRFLSPAMLSALFIIIVLFGTFSSYKEDRLTFHFLDGGMLLGIAVLIYVPSLFTMLLMIIILLLFRKRIWQEWIYPWIGFGLPFLFWASYLFLTDQPLHIIKDLFTGAFTASPHSQAFSKMQLIFYGYIAVLLLIASLHMVRTINIQNIQARIFYFVFFWLFVLSLLTVWIVPASGTGFLYPAGISIAFLLGNYFNNCRNTRFNNLLLGILLAGIILLIADDWLSIIPGSYSF